MVSTVSNAIAVSIEICQEENGLRVKWLLFILFSKPLLQFEQHQKPGRINKNERVEKSFEEKINGTVFSRLTLVTLISAETRERRTN